jgi:hypothetical protein
MKLNKRYITVFGLVVVFLLTACGGGGGGSSSSTVDFQDISYHVPEGVKVLAPNASKEKSKLFLAGENGEVSGFFVTDGSQSKRKSKQEKREYAKTILYSTINGGSIGSLSLLSSQKITSPYVYTVSHYKMSTYIPMKPLELSEKLLYKITGQSNIEPLNSKDGEEASEFRVIYTKGIREGVSFQLVSIVPVSKYKHYESICNTMINGARVMPKGTPVKNESQTFKAKAGNKKADFLFVIDDSGSMADDQDALSKSASDFTAEMRQSGLNYRAAIITTSYQPGSSYYNWDVNHILRDTGIIENDEELLKEKLVAGTHGSNTETGIYNAEKALRSIAHGDSEDGEVTKLGMPLSDATLSVIIISDEDSQYNMRAGYQFDVKHNLFLDRKVRVYSIINPSYNSRYNLSQYDDLAYESGGTVADIDGRNSSGELDYSAIMEQIAKDAGGVASTFVLDHRASEIVEVSIDNKVIKNDSENGYTFLQSSNSIVLHGSALPKSDFSISIYYKYGT